MEEEIKKMTYDEMCELAERCFKELRDGFEGNCQRNAMYQVYLAGIGEQLEESGLTNDDFSAAVLSAALSWLDEK